MKKIAGDIIGFMDVVEQLCYVQRFTKMVGGRSETDSDHIMKLCFLVMMISPYIKQRHDTQKMLEIALVHDLVEAEVGDIPYFEQLSSDEIKKLKKESEARAIEKYKSILPPPLNNKIYDLFYEYEKQETLEAKVVHALDVFDGNLQCNKENFGARYWEMGVGKRLSEMSNHKYGNDIGEEIIKEIENVLVELSNTNRYKCLNSVE